MAYDSARGVTVLFGGASLSGVFSDTWEWDGTSWTQLSPAASPPARDAHAMATLGSKVVLFGGGNGTTAVNDTWSYSTVLVQGSDCLVAACPQDEDDLRRLYAALAKSLGLANPTPATPVVRAPDLSSIAQLQEADILVVDDIELNRDLMSELFATTGLKVRLASNGVEALARVRDQRLRIFLEHRCDHHRGHAVLHVVEVVQQVAGHQEVDAAGRQQRPVVDLRAALLEGDIEAEGLVGAVGHRLVEAAVRGLRLPVGGEGHLVLRQHGRGRECAQRGNEHHR